MSKTVSSAPGTRFPREMCLLLHLCYLSLLLASLYRRNFTEHMIHFRRFLIPKVYPVKKEMAARCETSVDWPEEPSGRAQSREEGERKTKKILYKKNKPWERSRSHANPNRDGDGRWSTELAIKPKSERRKSAPFPSLPLLSLGLLSFYLGEDGT